MLSFSPCYEGFTCWIKKHTWNYLCFMVFEKASYLQKKTVLPWSTLFWTFGMFHMKGSSEGCSCAMRVPHTHQRSSVWMVAQQNKTAIESITHLFPAGKMWFNPACPKTFKSIFMTIIVMRKGLYFNPRISNRAMLLRVGFTGLYGTTFWMLRTSHEKEGVWCVGI